MKTEYKAGVKVKVVNWIIKNLSKRGRLPDRIQTLIVKGRKTGKVFETPVSIVDTEDGKWIVAPYGEVNWVKNIRAADQVEVRMNGGLKKSYTASEITAKESAPVIKKYLEIEKFPKDYFQVTERSTLLEIEGEAHRYPVFQLFDVQHANI